MEEVFIVCIVGVGMVYEMWKGEGGVGGEFGVCVLW